MVKSSVSLSLYEEPEARKLVTYLNLQKKKAHWLCNCHCGTKDKVVQGANLVSGKIISCGCIAAKKAANRARERFEIDDSSYIDYETEGF
jgi:hypothetical protein